MSSIVNVAIIGCGHLGKWHVQKAIDLSTANLVAVVERSIERKKEMEELYPNTRVVTSIDEVINEIDAAIIVTPTSTHYQICKNLLENKKHIFCEKPLCEKTSEAEELNELAKANKLTLQVGHSERFHEIWEKRDLFEAHISENTLINIERVAAFKGRATDTSVISDLMIHDLDILYFLTGELPCKVKAKGIKSRTDKWDHVEAEYSFKNNINSRVVASRIHLEEKRLVEIIGEKGSSRIDLLNANFKGVNLPSTQLSDINYPKRDHLYLEQEEFYNCILNNKEPRISGDVGKAVISILEATERALSEGSEVNV